MQFIVNLTNVKKTGEVAGIPTYNGLFFKLKEKYYSIALPLIKKYYDIVLKYREVYNVVNNMSTIYYNMGFYETVDIKYFKYTDELEASLLLKALNLLDKYEPLSKYNKIFNIKFKKSENSGKILTDILMEMITDAKHPNIVYNILENHFNPSDFRKIFDNGVIYSKGFRIPFTGRVFDTLQRLLILSVLSSRKNHTNFIDINKLNNKFSNFLKKSTFDSLKFLIGTNEEDIYVFSNLARNDNTEPVFSINNTSSTSGHFYVCGVNGKGFLFYRPIFSDYYITMRIHYKPDKVLKVVTPQEYYDTFKSLKVRAVSQSSLCYNVFDRNFYVHLSYPEVILKFSEHDLYDEYMRKVDLTDRGMNVLLKVSVRGEPKLMRIKNITLSQLYMEVLYLNNKLFKVGKPNKPTLTGDEELISTGATNNVRLSSF